MTLDVNTVFLSINSATVAEWYRYQIVTGFVTSSSPVPLKTRRVGQRCMLNMPRAEMSSRWCGVVVRRGASQLRCRPRHLTMVPNYVVRRQKPSCRRLAARTLPPVTIRELRLALQDEWAAMPQQLIDTLILSMGRRCETCLAVRGDHIPY
ncbi:uncharacterized protein TNCV_5106291 [Trichonephila clavipes]|nr:uncharacterized protein TNCV_5106291 [Trichonephila clavipes]